MRFRLTVSKLNGDHLVELCSIPFRNERQMKIFFNALKRKHEVYKDKMTFDTDYLIDPIVDETFIDDPLLTGKELAEWLTYEFKGFFNELDNFHI